MTVRTDSVVMLTIAGLTGLGFVVTRGFWSAAPLLVIAAAGLYFHLASPVPKEQPGRNLWANVNLVALLTALAATWYQSSVMLAVGVLFAALSLAVPRFQRKQ